MSEAERKIVPFIPVKGAPRETIFGDLYASVSDGSVEVLSWNDITDFSHDEYTYVVTSRVDEQDEQVIRHHLHPNSHMEWWGTMEEPRDVFVTHQSPDAFEEVQQKILESKLNLEESTTRVNVIFMDPELLAIDVDHVRNSVEEKLNVLKP